MTDAMKPYMKYFDNLQDRNDEIVEENQQELNQDKEIGSIDKEILGLEKVWKKTNYTETTELNSAHFWMN